MFTEENAMAEGPRLELVMGGAVCDWRRLEIPTNSVACVPAQADTLRRRGSG